MRDVGLVDHMLDFGNRQHLRRQAHRYFRQHQFGRRVVQQMAAAGGPLEEAFQRHQQQLLARKSQRPAVRLAVVEQVPLVALQDRQRHFLRLLYAVLVAPRNETAQGFMTQQNAFVSIAGRRQPLQVRVHVDVDWIRRRGIGRCNLLRGAPLLVQRVLLVPSHG